MRTPAKIDQPLTSEELADKIVRRSPKEAVRVLVAQTPEVSTQALELVNPSIRWKVLRELPEDRREALLEAAEADSAAQWRRNLTFADETVGSMMDAPIGVLRPETTIAEATEILRALVRKAFITYLFVTDAKNRLIGVVVMREMMLGRPEQKLEEIMLRDPFTLKPGMKLKQAMMAVLNKHYPVYPVADDSGQLVGLLRGQTMFEAQAIEISAQAGSMVGVEKEERLTTPWPRSLIFRHPWLQLNLLTAFVAAAVVGIFQETLDQLVILAVFLPVLAGQSGNTGCQALAVTLRGMTLGELRSGREMVMVLKEALLGFANGALVGLTAGIGMFVYARLQGNVSALGLGVIVFFAMTMSCVISGVSGAVVPLVLKKLGADPATASSIFLTTATDVASMGIFLGLATVFIL